MKSGFKKVYAFTFSEWVTVFVALILLPVIAACLKLAGFDVTSRLLNKLSPSPQPVPKTVPGQIEEANRLAQTIGLAANRGPYHATCLPKSMLLRFLLKWRSIDNELKIGVNKSKQLLAAHAWVEVNGVPLNEDGSVNDRFATFELQRPD